MKSYLKRARELYENRTESEVLFSRYLTEAGFEFREQQPVGKYFVDFYFPGYGHRIIELDGKCHDERKDYDAQRDRWLFQHGFVVKRFQSRFVFIDKDGLIERVTKWLKSPLPKRRERVRKKTRRRALEGPKVPKGWAAVEKLTKNHLPVKSKSLRRPVEFEKPKIKGWEPSKPRQIKIVKANGEEME